MGRRVAKSGSARHKKRSSNAPTSDSPPVKYPVRPRPSTGSTGSKRPLAKTRSRNVPLALELPQRRARRAAGQGKDHSRQGDRRPPHVVFEDDVVLFFGQGLRLPIHRGIWMSTGVVGIETRSTGRPSSYGAQNVRFVRIPGRILSTRNVKSACRSLCRIRRACVSTGWW